MSFILGCRAEILCFNFYLGIPQLYVTAVNPIHRGVCSPAFFSLFFAAGKQLADGAAERLDLGFFPRREQLHQVTNLR